jgi:predicted transcriptional regulator
MSLPLPPGLRALVDERLSTGLYEGDEQVLAVALGTLAWKEGSDLAAIQRGIAQRDAGGGKPAEEVIAELRVRFGVGQQ